MFGGRVVVPWCTALLTLWSHAAGIGWAKNELQICRYCESGEYADFVVDGQTDIRNGDRRYAPHRHVDVKHIRLEITPNFKTRTLRGVATIRFAPIAEPIRELRLDAVHLTIGSVRGSSPVEDHFCTNDDLTITFDEPLPTGEEAWVEIQYHAQPRRGLYFRTPELGYPASDAHLFTQGETHEARHWFPCFDYPNERSSTEVICHVPSDMTVLSNGDLVSERIDDQTGVKTVHWYQQKPHVNYLVNLVAGYFSKLEGRHGNLPLAFYTQPSLAEHAANSFQDTADIMAFFEDEIGVPFPWNKYYQVTVRDFHFGGMENTTLTTLTHFTIFTNDTENIRSSRTLDAHEMAHQWFGDYVTCKDWSHTWLNEGFATYYAHLYEGHKFGRDALLYGLYRDAQNGIFSHREDRRPIVYNRYERAFDQFDYRAYPKGSWVLHMLRSQLGEDLYRRCIRTYLERNALTSVETSDLLDVIEELSGRSFDPFFDQWIYHGRHPELKISYRWLGEDRLAKVTVEQTHQVDDDVLLFGFPTVLRFYVDDRVIDQPIEISKQKHDFFVSLPNKPTIVRFDPQFTVLAEIDFDKSEDMLLAQLNNERDVIGRLMAIDQLSGRKKQAIVKAVGAALANDPFYGVQRAAAQALAKMKNEEALAELTSALNAEDARVRQEVVTSLGKFYHPDALRALKEVVDSEHNPAIVAEAIRAMGKYLEPETQQIVLEKMRSDSFRHELAAAAVDAMGDQKDAAQRALLIEVLGQDQHKFTSQGLAAALTTLASITRPLDVDEKNDVEVFLRGFVGHKKEPIRVAAVRALGQLGDARSSAVLQTLADEESDDRTARAAVSALRQLRREAPVVPDELKELRELVGELKDETKKLRTEMDELKSKAEASSHEELNEPTDAAEDDAVVEKDVEKPATTAEATGG